MALLNNKIEHENIHRFTHKAMATLYEILIEYDDKVYAEQAAKAAFDEIDRLEEELSRFLPNSEISMINNLKSGDKLLLSEDPLECLSQSQKLFEITNGAFDITAGSYIENGNKENISVEQTNVNKQIPLHQKFEINESEHTITVLSENLNIDLGGIGKGYALDKVCDLLLEWDIENAFIHGGGSSVKSIGSLNKFNGWPITLSNPNNPQQTLADILVKDFSISASGIKKGDHIFDPVLGKPITKRKAAWAITNSAALSDALSTAFMIMDIDSILELGKNNNDIGALIIEDEKAVLARNDLIISDNLKAVEILI